MKTPNSNPPSNRMYGVVINASIATGDLENMKRVKADAEKWLSDHGDVRGALAVLNAEIAKREAQKS